MTEEHYRALTLNLSEKPSLLSWFLAFLCLYICDLRYVLSVELSVKIRHSWLIRANKRDKVRADKANNGG